jgi:hypothetical protein
MATVNNNCPSCGADLCESGIQMLETVYNRYNVSLDERGSISYEEEPANIPDANIETIFQCTVCCEILEITEDKIKDLLKG